LSRAARLLARINTPRETAALTRSRGPWSGFRFRRQQASARRDGRL